MAIKYVGTMSFKNLEDVRSLMDLVGRGLQIHQKAARTLDMAGFGINTEVQQTARKEARHMAVLMLNLADEFKRLHSGQCEDPEHCEFRDADKLVEMHQKMETELIHFIKEVDREGKVAEKMGIVAGPDVTVVDLDAALDQDYLS